MIAGAALVLMATACNDASSITGPEVAHAKPAFDLGSGPIALDVPWGFVETNPCIPPEVVETQGKTHIVVNSTGDVINGFHFTYNITHSGSGVGLTSGLTYRLVDNTTLSIQDPDPTISYKEEHQFVMVAPKPAVNYIQHVLIKFTFNANDMPTADVTWMFNKCDGDGEKVDISPP